MFSGFLNPSNQHGSPRIDIFGRQLVSDTVPSVPMALYQGSGHDATAGRAAAATKAGTAVLTSPVLVANTWTNLGIAINGPGILNLISLHALTASAGSVDVRLSWDGNVCWTSGAAVIAADTGIDLLGLLNIGGTPLPAPQGMVYNVQVQIRSTAAETVGRFVLAYRGHRVASV